MADQQQAVKFQQHLFGGVPVLMHSIYWRNEDHLQGYWTRPNVPGPRLNHLHICLLIGNDIFSAGEQFASDLKAHQRAVLIGETTGGGAHPGASYRLNSHFELFIPTRSAINPITNQCWEGSAINPDISGSEYDALQIAHQIALKAIIDEFGYPYSASQDQLLEEAREALKHLGI